MANNASKFQPKSEYAKKLLDPRWQKMRLEVFQRDNYTCQSCGSTEKTLHAHHTFYRSDVDGPWDYQPSSIVTLCDECHEIEHVSFAEKKNWLIESAAAAGFRTSEEVGRLRDILDMLAAAISGAASMDDVNVMIDSHVSSVRRRSE